MTGPVCGSFCGGCRPERRSRPKRHVGYTRLLKTLPGAGEILGAIIWLEAGEVKRFAPLRTWPAYAGLIRTVHSSNGKTWMGHTLTARLAMFLAVQGHPASPAGTVQEAPGKRARMNSDLGPHEQNHAKLISPRLNMMPPRQPEFR